MSKVIVTLTTLPSRISQEYDTGMKSNIASLLDQDYEGYEIHLNVPTTLKTTGEAYVIPEWLREVERDNPNFKIFEVGEDMGAVTKLYYTLKRETDPDTIIIVCDDDLVYHPEMVKEQVRNQEKHKRASVGYDGSRADDPSVFNDVRNHFVVSVYFDIDVNILQHYKTVSYRRSFFDDDFFTDFVGKSWNDDVLVAAYMSKQNVRKIVTYWEGEDRLETIEQWNERGGVLTFPVLRHTSHEGAEGCYHYRSQNIDAGDGYFRQLGFLK
jgi:hypothetical protein